MNKAAQELGRKRWKNVSKKEHSMLARKAVRVRWDKVNKEKMEKMPVIEEGKLCTPTD